MLRWKTVDIFSLKKIDIMGNKIGKISLLVKKLSQLICKTSIREVCHFSTKNLTQEHHYHKPCILKLMAHRLLIKNDYIANYSLLK